MLKECKMEEDYKFRARFWRVMIPTLSLFWAVIFWAVYAWFM